MIDSVIKDNLCISCGICTLNGNASMQMVKGINIPKFNNELDTKEKKELYDICPGKGYPIVKMGEKQSLNENIQHDYRLGYYNSIGAARSKDDRITKNSTSGGMIPAVANYLLENNIVNGVLTVKTIYTKNGPEPKPFIATNLSDLISSQGSKYRPIPLFENIDNVINFDGNLAVIGTPCQIAGLRMLQEVNSKLNKKIKFTITNFCGGYRDYRETERIFELKGINKKNIEFFTYRGKGQPGSMLIKEAKKDEINLPYPDYARLTGHIKYKRCRLCVDATGELSDLSFGDAWMPKYLNSGNKWSFFISRTETGRSVLKKMFDDNLFHHSEISKEELIESQSGNINTKKERQNSRNKLYEFLGVRIPAFDGGYSKKDTNLKLELKVATSHNIFLFLEKIKLYTPIARLIKRIK
ncbi:Coenzyme F420 hydrogenase/dehydrogenase, beta subunit C-terminal domain [Gillisia hiemivivida]|uniref:Coenzyme F420 hydrogenase n=1 Tax=Gillisia hiemivivida TaxID=291190 RepID=A0A5C7A071_9FLAO|nr:Coenzyme F420 hydrogenase/dehydrogenase, beta subunit C-terminal domain [Gillisia hiemivivida]TXD95740.1 hypothetical protein ES724_01575 [Gillisia hiemivivida]